MGLFGVGNRVQTVAAVLAVEPNNRGPVSVSLEGGEMKRAETGLRLYPGDSVVTSVNAYARIDLFDGTRIRLDEESHVSIGESRSGEEKSSLRVDLKEGTLWIATPTQKMYSGSIVRTVGTPRMKVDFPTKAEAVMSRWSITVFSADGLGVTLDYPALSKSIMIGEGQQYTLPASEDVGPDPYEYRSPLDPSVLLSSFVEESRKKVVEEKLIPPAADDDIEPTDEVALMVDQPEDGITVMSATIDVSGRIGKDVEQVRVNGYQAIVNSEKRTFTQELALPDEDEVSILIEAVDENGNVLSEIRRTLTRDREPPEPPTITFPAKAGQTYQTTSTQLEITGTAPAGAIGISVNDYRLQLFKPGDDKWSYIANVNFGNYLFGENKFEVFAINRGGYKSDTAVLKVVLVEEGEEKVIDFGEPDEESEDAEEAKEPREPTAGELPDNDPLMKGSLKVISPNGGVDLETNEKEFLIEGKTSANTDSLWVNGYRLRLYEAGKESWNYIASTELGTLKRGRNIYHIVARDADYQILDILDYVVTFKPGRN